MKTYYKNYFGIGILAMTLSACGLDPSSATVGKTSGQNGSFALNSRSLQGNNQPVFLPYSNTRFFSKSDADIAVSLNAEKPSQKAMRDFKQFAAESTQMFAQDSNLQQQMTDDVTSLVFLAQFGLASKLSQALESTHNFIYNSSEETQLINDVNAVLVAADNSVSNTQASQQNALTGLLLVKLTSLKRSLGGLKLDSSLSQLKSGPSGKILYRLTPMDNLAQQVINYYESLVVDPTNISKTDLAQFLKQCGTTSNLTCPITDEMHQNLLNNLSALTAAKQFDLANQIAPAAQITGQKGVTADFLAVPNNNVLTAQMQYFLNQDPIKQNILNANLLASMNDLALPLASFPRPSSELLPTIPVPSSERVYDLSVEMINYYTFTSKHPIAKMLLDVANFRVLTQEQRKLSVELNEALANDIIAMTLIGEYRCAYEIANMLGTFETDLMPKIGRVIDAAAQCKANQDPSQKARLNQVLQNAIANLRAANPLASDKGIIPYLAISICTEYTTELQNGTL